MTTTRDLDLSIDLPATPDVVYRAISDGDEIAKWFAPRARADERSIFLSWGEGMEITEPISRREPGRRLRYAFGDAPLEVEWTVTPRGALTTLRLRHTGFSTKPEADESFESHARGWRIFMLNLKHYLTHHAGEPCRQRPFVVKTPLDRAEVWRHVVALEQQAKTRTIEEGRTHYHVEIGGGRTLSGVVEVFAKERDVALTVGEDDALLLRVSLEKAAPGTMIYGVVLGYGPAAAQAEPLAKDVEAALRGALATAT